MDAETEHSSLGTGRRATIRDVARLAKVSLGTVSRVINNNRTVRDAVRAKVLEAARTLGYVPDAVAQSMRTQTTRAIGCIVSDVANPLFASVVSGAEEVINRAEYNMVLTNSSESLSRETEILELFRRRRLEGVMMTMSREDDPATVTLIQNLRAPVVLIERESSAGVDSVASDHYAGTLQAMGYLLMLGHRRIGLITVTRAALPGRARARAFEAALQAAGVPLDPRLMAGSGFTADYGYNAAYEMLMLPEPPTAIVAGANQMVGVLKATRALNIDMPRRLSLISLGDTDLAELHSPPLSVVRWDSKKVGATAAQLLLSRLSNKSPRDPQRIVLPTELVVRQSCAPPGCSSRYPHA